LKVIEYVGELHGKAGANAFRELEVLGDGRIHIPTIQAVQIANAPQFVSIPRTQRRKFANTEADQQIY